MADTINQFEINGNIGAGYYSFQYVQYMLSQMKPGPVRVKVTSFGGDVNHALKIKDLFTEHGDVTVEYVGFNASAATIIGLGAKKTLINEDSMYLIHKPMVSIAEWGMMNEDELQAAIDRMEAEKDSASTVTMVLAQSYSKTRGIQLSTVIELMEQQRWLTAHEAVGKKLVDEVLPTKNKTPTISNQIRSLMISNGIPEPQIQTEPQSGLKTAFDSLTERIINLENIFSPKNKLIMHKEFTCINTLLGVEGLNEQNGKIVLNERELKSIDEKLSNYTEEIENANTARQKAEQQVTDLFAQIDTLDPGLKNISDHNAKIKAIAEKLASRPGTEVLTPEGNGKNPVNQKDNTDWDVINSLPYNKEADELY